MKEQQNTEAAILKAAEEEFLDKGFARSKTTDIAKAAGVTHAMLHYYFRTKENLFDKVFQEKAKLVASSFDVIIDDELPFLEKIAKSIEAHFDFLSSNPKLPLFVVNEIIGNAERKETCKQIFLPIVIKLQKRLKQEIDKEVASGTINPITPLDLIFSIVSLNLFAFLGRPIIDMVTGNDEKARYGFMEHRKQENIEVILSRLRKS